MGAAPSTSAALPRITLVECVSDLGRAACAGTISGAVQPAVHDLFDSSVARSWLNNPLSNSLETDIFTATNIAKGFAQLGALAPERSIPASILADAAGFAIFSVAKVTPMRRRVCQPSRQD